MNSSVKPAAPKEYAYRWNLRTEEWERSEKGKGLWATYNRKAEENFEDDVVFIKTWLEQVRENGSRADLCKIFCKKDRHIRSKWRRVNKKLVDQFGLPENQQVLPSLPDLTKAQKARRTSHFTAKPKPKTLKDKVQALDEWMVKLLDLKKPKKSK